MDPLCGPRAYWQELHNTKKHAVRRESPGISARDGENKRFGNKFRLPQPKICLSLPEVNTHRNTSSGTVIRDIR